MLRLLLNHSAKLFSFALVFIALQLFAGKAAAQTVIYTQNFGAVSHGALPSGWVASGTVGANISLNTTDPSMGYTIFDGPTASGGGQLEDGQGTPMIGTAYVTVSGVISTVGYSDITIQYAAYMSSSNTEDPGLAWSTDGITWNPISYTPPVTGSETWTLINAAPISLPPGAAGQSNLQFQWTYVRTNTNGSYRMDDFTVEGVACVAPVITGSTSVTVGATTTLSDATTGGTWSSASTAVATISAAGVVTGVSAGTAAIIYTLPSGCTTGAILTVYAPPGSPITGTTTVCTGSSTTLTDASEGTWSSGSTAVATVDTIGDVFGVTTGTTTITFTYTGGGSTTAIVTVNTIPVAAPITGPDSVCAGYTVTLADASTPGRWGTSNVLAATVSHGVVSGLSPGPVTIYYAIANECGGDTVTYAMNVNNCISEVAPVSRNAGNKIIVFPNPNQGAFTLLLSSPANERAQITITNILGEQVQAYTVATNQETALQLCAPPGMYFVTAVTGEGSQFAKVVVR